MKASLESAALDTEWNVFKGNSEKIEQGKVKPREKKVTNERKMKTRTTREKYDKRLLDAKQ